MNRRSHHRQGHFLTALSSWRRLTVPSAALLLLVQSFGMLYCQVRAATQAYDSEFTPEMPIPLPADPAAYPDARAGQMQQVGADLVSDERRAEIMAEARAGMFHFKPVGNAPAGALSATNPDRGFDLSYSTEGMRITPKQARVTLPGSSPSAPAWQVLLAARSLEVDTAAIPLHSPTGPPIASEERVTTQLAPGCSEWYVNRPSGLEHGFTVDEQVAGGAPAEQLTVSLEVDSTLAPFLEDGEIRFKNQHDHTLLVYRELHVFDHAGTELPSSMGLRTSPVDGTPEIRLTADVRGAVFPITIDPVMVDQQAMPMASDAAQGDEYGFSSATHGDRLVVGAPGNGEGKVYVYQRNIGGAGNFGEEDTLELPASPTPRGPGTPARFGESVCIGTVESTGQTYIVVGAPDYLGCGAVFVFLLVATTWTYLTRIFPSELTAGAKFGCAVALYGTFLAIGAYGMEKAGGAKTGAVFIFTLVLAAWTFLQMIIPPSAVAGDEVGRSVAITIRDVLFGAPGTDSRKGVAYLYSRALVAGALFLTGFILFSGHAAAGSEFGWAVALTLTLLVISAPRATGSDGMGGTPANAGALFLWRFAASTGLWKFIGPLFGAVVGALMGWSLAINYFGDIVAGQPGSVAGQLGGAIVLFLFNVATQWWDPGQTILPQGFVDTGMQFGFSVALLGTLLFVMAMGYFFNQGAMYRLLLTATAIIFAVWQTLFFTAAMIANPALQHLVGPNGDYSGDGIPNIVKWAMGLSALLFNAAVFKVVAASNGYLQFILPISLAAAAAGALLLIQYSLGLGTWSNAFPFADGVLAGQFFQGFLELGITSNLLVISISLAVVLTFARGLYYRVQEA